MPRKPYPTDVSDEEWSFAAPYLTLMDQHAPQREHDLREVFNALRWLVRAGAPWRMLPNDLPPWEAVYQQSRRWLDAGCFEAMVSDLRSIIRVTQGRQGQPSAVVMDGRTLQSSCESGPRAGYDGYKRKRGSKVHMAVDTLGHLLAVHVTPADEQERAQVQRLCEDVQQATGHTVQLAWADQGYTGEAASKAAQDNGIELQIVKLPEAKKGFVLLPRRWVVERSFGWLARFRRLSRDYERLPEVLGGLHFLVFAVLMLPAAARVLSGFKVGQRVLFAMRDGEIRIHPKPVRVVGGRLLSSRVRHAVRSHAMWGPRKRIQ
jgi:transposase